MTAVGEAPHQIMGEAMAAAAALGPTAVDELRATAARLCPSDPWVSLWQARDLMTAPTARNDPDDLVAVVAVGLVALATAAQGRADRCEAYPLPEPLGDGAGLAEDLQDLLDDPEAPWGLAFKVARGRRRVQKLADSVGVGVDAVRRLDALVAPPEEEWDRAVAAAILEELEFDPAAFDLDGGSR